MSKAPVIQHCVSPKLLAQLAQMWVTCGTTRHHATSLLSGTERCFLWGSSFAARMQALVVCSLCSSPLEACRVGDQPLVVMFSYQK